MVDAQRAVENIIIKLKMVDPFNLDDGMSAMSVRWCLCLMPGLSMCYGPSHGIEGFIELLQYVRDKQHGAGSASERGKCRS